MQHSGSRFLRFFRIGIPGGRIWRICSCATYTGSLVKKAVTDVAAFLFCGQILSCVSLRKTVYPGLAQKDRTVLPVVERQGRNACRICQKIFPSRDEAWRKQPSGPGTVLAVRTNLFISRSKCTDELLKFC